jgi:DNA-binding LacI/PurR family transcriptional regulator
MPSIIEQIAADLKVSSATVSRALNDRPGVSQALRERILERAREMNYTPNMMARGLVTSQTFTLGFFVRQKPDLSAQTDPFYGKVLQGVEQISAASEYHVAIGMLTSEILNTPTDFRFVRERRIDGMVLAGPDIPTDFIMAMKATDVPIVLVDNKLAHSSIDCINTDDEEGGYDAARHLIDGGHRHIGVISGPKHWHSSVQRVRGMQQALLEADLPQQIIHVERTTIESGEKAAEQLLSAHPEVTGICAVNDAMALGAIRAARRMGRQIPDDLSVVGFDNIDWAQLNDPPLTTVHVPKQQLGQEAARRLLNLLGDRSARPVEIMVSTELVVRQSTRSLNGK